MAEDWGYLYDRVRFLQGQLGIITIAAKQFWELLGCTTHAEKIKAGRHVKEMGIKRDSYGNYILGRELDIDPDSLN